MHFSTTHPPPPLTQALTNVFNSSGSRTNSPSSVAALTSVCESGCRLIGSAATQIAQTTGTIRHN